MAIAAKPAGVRPDLNLSDIPEMLAGARPGANPAARFQFEQRCKELHAEAMAEVDEAEQSRGVLGVAALADLEAMFPALDASLVRALAAESLTPQHALETLLTLSAATSDSASTTTTLEQPALKLETDDMRSFPSLTDADGWQLTSRRGFELDRESDDKTAWRDRAKLAASLPAPVVSRKLEPATRRKQQRAESSVEIEADAQLADSYELRQQHGSRRAKKFSQRGLTSRASKQRHAEDALDHACSTSNVVSVV